MNNCLSEIYEKRIGSRNRTIGGFSNNIRKYISDENADNRNTLEQTVFSKLVEITGIDSLSKPIISRNNLRNFSVEDSIRELIELGK